MNPSRSKREHRPNRRVRCGHCGMTYGTRMACERCLFRVGGADPSCAVCHGTLDAGPAAKHECPEPLPYETAYYLFSFYSSPGAPPTSQRMKARIKLGLESNPHDRKRDT